jgi:group I intron endonuclease
MGRKFSIMIIYKITNKVNGDFYIGKTSKTKEERLQRHFYNASYGLETYLYRAIRKHGKKNFIIEELENNIHKNKIDEKEIDYISKLNPKYNMTSGGDGGDTSKSPNFIKAIKKQHSNRSPESYASYGMKDKHHSEETKKRVGKANSYPVVCEGKEFSSIKAAEEYYKNLGTPKSVRKRIDSPKHTDWYRIREKRIYK